MRKRKKGRKFNRSAEQRKALLNSLASALFDKERIKTTEAKAKEISIFAEKLITKAKKNSLSVKRELYGVLSDKAAKKLMGEVSQRFSGRNGGYTRVLKLGPRKSDSSNMAIIELVK